MALQEARMLTEHGERAASVAKVAMAHGINDVRVELRRGPVSIAVTWPFSAAPCIFENRGSRDKQADAFRGVAAEALCDTNWR